MTPVFRTVDAPCFRPSRDSLARTYRPHLPLLGAGILMGALGGCEVPTESPQWDQRWIVPAEETTVDVENLLPESVTPTADGSAFAVEVAPTSFQESLESLCPACQPLDGQVAPKPAFQSSFQDTATLPSDLEQATVKEGRVRVQLFNGLSFDPIRPGGGASGTITLSLFRDGAGSPLLAQTTMDGTTESFGPGTTVTRTLSFSGEVGSGITVVVGVDSPSGDPASIDLDDRVQVDVSVPTLEVSAAVIQVGGRELLLDQTELDVGDVDESVVDRIISGALNMDIQNPWGIGATFAIQLDTPSGPISKAFSMAEGPTSTARIEFTQDELRRFLGQPGVVLRGTGVVAPNAGAVALTPGQTMRLDTELDLVIRIGGEEG